jgi:hypothetical protein
MESAPSSVGIAASRFGSTCAISQRTFNANLPDRLKSLLLRCFHARRALMRRERLTWVLQIASNCQQSLRKMPDGFWGHNFSHAETATHIFP